MDSKQTEMENRNWKDMFLCRETATDSFAGCTWIGVCVCVSVERVCKRDESEACSIKAPAEANSWAARLVVTLVWPDTRACGQCRAQTCVAHCCVSPLVLIVEMKVKSLVMRCILCEQERVNRSWFQNKKQIWRGQRCRRSLLCF